MRELVGVYEQWDGAAYLFLRSIVVWKDGENFYRTCLPIRQSEITDTTLDTLSHSDIVPREHYCGSWDDTFTEAPNPLPLDSFLKRRSLILYDGTPSVGGQLVIEAHILEKLAKNPHPNIVTYYGCVREGDLLSAICIKRYPTTLDGEIENLRLSPTRQRLILDGLAAGLSHLHAMGLVHNDLNPDNVMLNDDGTPVIIDFDICREEGDVCSPGTPGWARPQAGIQPCTKENDLYALGLIKRYMEGDYDGTDYGFDEPGF